MFPLFVGKTHHFPTISGLFCCDFPGLAFGGRADDHSARVRLLIGLKGGDQGGQGHQKMDGFYHGFYPFFKWENHGRNVWYVFFVLCYLMVPAHKPYIYLGSSCGELDRPGKEYSGYYQCIFLLRLDSFVADYMWACLKIGSTPKGVMGGQPEQLLLLNLLTLRSVQNLWRNMFFWLVVEWRFPIRGSGYSPIIMYKTVVGASN